MDDKQLETAARHACTLLGIDANECIYDENGWLQPRWTFLVPKVREQWAINSALQFVAWKGMVEQMHLESLIDP
jgi:hypothetical protein